MPELSLPNLGRSYVERAPADLERICATPRAVAGAWAALLILAAAAALLVSARPGATPAAPAVAAAPAARPCPSTREGAAMNLAAVDLNLLKAFDALMSEGSVTLAADKIGLTQPALSNALSRLRHLFDDRLFVRTPDGMQPTARARQLAAPIQRALRDIKSALDSAPTFEPATARRTFTLGLSDITSLHLALGVAERLYRLAPGVDLHTRAIDPKDAAPLLDGGDIDLAVGVLPAPPPRLKRRRLYSESGRVVACAGHPALRDGMSIEQLAALPHVVVSPLGLPMQAIDEELAERGIRRRIALTIPSPLALPYVLRATDRIAILPRHLAERVTQSGGLRVHPLPLALRAPDVSMLWHGRDDGDPATVWLCDLVVEASRCAGPPAAACPATAAA
jgi:DNA-binding transcriptional LysR family regulator